MILRLSDWYKYNGAIVDTSTSNESFLRLASVYSQMGIKNNAFMLALLQPSLQGIDPHSPNLDIETKAAIALEAKWNPWYAVREIIKFPPQGGVTPIPFKANRGNIALMWSFFNHIDFANIQPRQTGKSASTDSLWVIILTLMGINTHIQLVTKDNDLRKENVIRLKSIRDLLPKYLNSTSNIDSDNKESVTCLVLGNHYKTAVGRPAREAADNLGRGLTSQILQCDEVPYVPNIHISLPVALSSGTAAKDNAKAAGGFYGNIFTTTAGKRDTKEGKFAYKLVHNGMYWNEALLDEPTHDELIATVLRNSSSKTPTLNGTFSHRQLGYTDEWLKEKIDGSHSGEDLANRDYLNVWSTGTETSPLSIRINETIHASEMDPQYSQVSKDKYILRWYIPHDSITQHLRDNWHVISLDSSNAIGVDCNGLVFSDVRDMSVTAVANIAEANLFRFAQWIADMLILYPKTVFVIENKSTAQGIIDVLLTILPKMGMDPFKRIYNRIVDQSERYEKEYEEINRGMSRRSDNIYLKYKGKFGYMTTGNSRSFLYDSVLQQAAKTGAHLVRDRVLSSEIRGLITKNGRVDHPEGGHDDVCFAWLLANYFISFSKNLDFYGLDPAICLSTVSEGDWTDSPEDAKLRLARRTLRIEIDNLKEELANASTTQSRMRLEHLLSIKVGHSEIDGGEAISLDAILQEAAKHKKAKSSLREAVKKFR